MTEKDRNLKMMSQMIEKQRAAFFSDGAWEKERTALAALVALKSVGEFKKALIITPKKSMGRWMDPDGRCFYNLDKDCILTYENLKIVLVDGDEAKRRKELDRQADVYIISKDLTEWLKNESVYGRFQIIIIDGVAGRKTQTYTAQSCLTGSARRLIILDDVPKAMELWERVFLIDKGQRLGSTIDEYRARYFKVWNSRNGFVWDWKLTENSDKKIAAAVRDVCIRVPKGEGGEAA